MFIVDQNNSVVTSTDLLKIIDGTRHTVQFIEIVSANRNFLAIKTNKGKPGKTMEMDEYVIRFILETLETHNT